MPDILKVSVEELADKNEFRSAKLRCEGECSPRITVHAFHGFRSSSETTYVIYRCKECHRQRVYGTVS